MLSVDGRSFAADAERSHLQINIVYDSVLRADGLTGQSAAPNACPGDHRCLYRYRHAGCLRIVEADRADMRHRLGNAAGLSWANSPRFGPGGRGRLHRQNWTAEIIRAAG
jgi:hypothetical protein